MRELYVGGYAQGKLAYVRRVKQAENIEIREIDCAAWQAAENCGEAVQADGISPKMQEAVGVFYHFHQWVRKLVLDGADAEGAFTRFMELYPNWIIISDEVGNGIVPMEHAERAYREVLGRILIEAATRAERVERVICGLGQRIK
ncbi:MAG: bifunctional adenosylcobinamide kinase/adenosylcobinamide-phosphate guanylyltransferase [Lachnospiraceae bacterium]|nr:bifunctional adenosylcobinamide kinase/adenosylcobinamide-phosphate guanylyltransferase [Lachnospiraceae bacterium]